jgi:hypothetical protein
MGHDMDWGQIERSIENMKGKRNKNKTYCREVDGKDEIR